MKSLKYLSNEPAGLNLLSDEILEFHASRILLLILICGSNESKSKSKKIVGLTKLAKLDFFVRYPVLFNMAASYLKIEADANIASSDANMIRFHYGPWDKRYYQILPFLESRNLIDIQKKSKQFEFLLTVKGLDVASLLMSKDSFNELVSNMQKISSVFGAYSGNKLKELIYQVFDKQVKNKNLEELI